MSETEYIRAGNLARVRAARSILEAITPGSGAAQEELREVIARLEDIEGRISEESFITFKEEREACAEIARGAARKMRALWAQSEGKMGHPKAIEIAEEIEERIRERSEM